MLFSASMFALNTFALKPLVGGWFLQGYFNDLFAMPFMLAYSNALISATRFRRHPIASFPACMGLTLVGAFIWEVLAPMVKPGSVASWGDVLAYFAGAAAYWSLRRVKHARSAPAAIDRIS